jgi:putative transcriptional regulator
VGFFFDSKIGIIFEHLFGKTKIMISQEIQKGNLLIAKPSILTDRSFNRAIIYLTEHNESGSVGFILNKPSKYLLKDLIFEIHSDLKVYIGGPVEQENLYFIHTVPELIPDSIEVSKGIFWGGNYEAVKSLINQNLIKNNEIRFFLGYSGWTFEQLEDELKENTWAIMENTYSNVLVINDSESWKEKLMEMGGKYKIWANSPEDPSLN